MDLQKKPIREARILCQNEELLFTITVRLVMVKQPGEGDVAEDEEISSNAMVMGIEDEKESLSTRLKGMSIVSGANIFLISRVVSDYRW